MLIVKSPEYRMALVNARKITEHFTNRSELLYHVFLEAYVYSEERISIENIERVAVRKALRKISEVNLTFQRNSKASSLFGQIRVSNT